MRPAREIKRNATKLPRALDGDAASSPKHDDRRGALVQATYALIAEKGIAGLRTRDIAAKVGVNISTLHYYFDTKEKLVVGAVDYVSELFQSVYAPLKAGATALDELRHIFESQEYRRRAAPELEIVVNEILVLARRDQLVRAALDRTLGVWRSAVEDIIARCVRDGSLPRSTEPKAIAAMITSLLLGATMQLGIRNSFALSDVADRVVAQLGATPATAKKRPRKPRA